MPASRKEIAVAFLRAAASGDVVTAYQKHVVTGFRITILSSVATLKRS
jgi:hypothetical protein